MNCNLRFALAATFLLIVAHQPLFGQGRFGGAVAVGDGEVLVLKPRASQGPAAVFVFREAEDGEWGVVERLHHAGDERGGGRFSASLAMMDGTLLVGGGDADGRWAAEAFGRDASGAWGREGALELASEGAATGSSDDAPIDRAAVFRILRPARRAVAVGGDLAVIGVVGGAREARGVRIMRRGGRSGRWSEEARLALADGDPNDQFGAAVALAGGRIWVGAPRRGESGAAFVFVRDPETAEWQQEAEIRADDLAPGSRFGTAVAVADDVALIGAPGTGEAGGAVIAYTRDADSGGWSESARVVSGDTDAGNQFGFAIAAAGDEIWVGAPGAEEGRGLIHRFVRDATGRAWRETDSDPVLGLAPGFNLGSSLALGADLGAAGAPGADGGMGRAAVFSRAADDSWREAVWLEPGGKLELITGGEVECGDGRAGQFSCQGVDLLAFLPVEALGGGSGEQLSDLWGWTDPETGREYALVGRTGGAVFIDIADPTAPVYLGVLPANPSGARDIKVYRDHVFFTGDGAGDHGLLVFDLSRLREVEEPPVTFEPDARYDDIFSAHNLAIDTASGFAYVLSASGGGQTCGGGLHMVDIRDPLHPTFAGCYTDTEGLLSQGRTHDAQCVVYRGPDADYRGREICFASNETALRIVDVTEKENPIPLAAARYPNLAYVHQVWLTEDQRYFYLDDELDELVGRADRTRTLVWDIADLDDPVFVGEYFGPNSATDHNLFIKGNLMYQANYQAGLRVVDISDPANPVEVGFFDTTPYEGDPPGFDGAWTAYPFFASGTVIVSSMFEGLFILKPRERDLLP